MPKVYCQNNLCPYWRKSRKFKNYGTCKKETVDLIWQNDDEYAVTGYNCQCLDSYQEREYIYGDEDE